MKLLRKIISEYVEEKILSEGFGEDLTPDSKYYAFDWDDNIVYMPTKILVLSDDDREVGMGSEDFAKYREQIGKEPFIYHGLTIVGFAKDPFRHFSVAGDKQFVIDALTAPPGPSWNDFVECLNGGSIFAIITARGHSPKAIREACKNYLLMNYNGLNGNVCYENLKKYRELTGEVTNSSKTQMIDEYLNLCKFYPVTHGEGSAQNPEQGKINALREFIGYVKEMSAKLDNRAFFKNDVKNFFVPQIGFSDDDLRNIEKIKGFLEKEYPEENPVKVFATHGGQKKEIK
jgi:hypothetical protein